MGVALWVAVREGQQRDAERRDAEAAQARLVLPHHVQSGSEVILKILNHSESPLLDVELRSVSLVDQRTNQRMIATRVTVHYFGGSSTTLIEFPAPVTLVLLDEVMCIAEGWAPEGTTAVDNAWEPAGGWDEAELDCVFRFTDATGLRWERWNRQLPKRIIEEQPA
ncbi:hypothetical protein [Streptomyces sp. NBC_01205]|uniref:hypothetical protein n=1 Tax=Streptomyces sp. NBC_01205 TaxID=2903771 RepID=UPI002E0FD40D|nr:hypothetical protein OG573_43300 [Streptomyces sp. NBC_01205]